MSAPFTPSREDGRSDRQVVYEMVKDATPETTFNYSDIQEALQDGIDTPIEKSRVYRAVASANRTLQKEQRRALRTVRGQGYRMLRSDEHLPVALERKERAEQQIKRGIEILRNTRLDELDATHRMMHEGQLLIMSGIYQATRETSRKVARQNAVIDEIRERLARLEGNVVDV